MMSLRYILKEMAIGAGTFLLIMSMVSALFMPWAESQKVHAGGIVYDPTNWIQNSLSAVADTFMAGVQASLQLKELTLDGIAFAVINLLIQEMSRSVVDWINSGFQGSPAFIQNPDRFFTNIADDLVGSFIWNSPDLQFLCSPFKLDVQLVLQMRYAKSRDYAGYNRQCRLSTVMNNIDDFFNGNMLEGGWDGWYQVAMVPENNPYGALLAAEGQMGTRLGNAQKNAELKLDFGKGFLSKEECVDFPGTGGGMQTECSIITPGTTIEKSLNDALGAPGRRIEVADEINEIVGALFTQLARQALSGAGGLLGLTGASGYTTPQGSYFDRVSGEPAGFTPGAGQNPISRALTDEIAYRNEYVAILTQINAAATYKVDTYGGLVCHPGTLTPELATGQATAQQNIANADAGITVLNDLVARYNAAANQPDSSRIQNEIMQEYLSLQNSGVIAGQTGLFEAQADASRTQLGVNQFIQEVDTACAAFINPGGA